VRSPLLTDLSIDWGGLPVTDVSPQRLPDLFSGQPVIITGRYTQAASGTVRLQGTRAGGPFRRDIPVAFSATAPSFEALAGFWARRRIDDLMSQDWLGIERGTVKPELEEQITRLGLDFRLLTQFTSFVAVEDKVVTQDGKPQRVAVPVEVPEGVSYEGVFGHNLSLSLSLSHWKLHCDFGVVFYLPPFCDPCLLNIIWREPAEAPELWPCVASGSIRVVAVVVRNERRHGQPNLVLS
jgi:hypothetical protein